MQDKENTDELIVNELTEIILVIIVVLFGEVVKLNVALPPLPRKNIRGYKSALSGGMAVSFLLQGNRNAKFKIDFVLSELLVLLVTRITTSDTLNSVSFPN